MAEKKLILAIIGKSGSGKTTLQDALADEHGISKVVSCTTRPKRGPEDNSHVFVNDETFDGIQNRLAETVYGGYKYAGILLDDKKKIYTYVIDVAGYEMLKKRDDVTVVPIIVHKNSEDRKKLIPKERYERDCHLVYDIPEAIWVRNNGTISGLCAKAGILIDLIKSEYLKNGESKN